MDIYLQSCGKKETQDYRWIKIYADSAWIEQPERQDPPFIDQLSKFYKPDTPAVILERNNQELRLLIYWLKTKERSVQYRRPVYNSIALVSKDKKDYLLLQMLASEALEDWKIFAEKFDGLVKWDHDNEHGFKVEQSQLLEYIQNQAKESSHLENADQTRKLAQDVLNVDSKSPEKQEIVQETKQEWIKKLADELKTSQLPNLNGLLVVVAENVAEEVLTGVVWRGISDRVKSSEVWIEIPVPEEEFKKKSFTPYVLLAIIVISLFVILITVVFSLSQPQKNPNPQPSLPQTHLSPTPPMIPKAEIEPSLNSQISPEAEIEPSLNSQISPEAEIEPSSNPPISPEAEIEPSSNPPISPEVEIETSPNPPISPEVEIETSPNSQISPESESAYLPDIL